MNTLSRRSLTLALLLAAAAAQADEARLVVTIKEIRDATGNLRISLYGDADSFRKEDRALKVVSLPAAKGETRVTFDGGGNATVASRRKVSSAPSIADRSLWFGANTRFVGDYNGVAVGPDGSTWSLWTDMRAQILWAPTGWDHGQHAVGTVTK